MVIYSGRSMVNRPARPHLLHEPGGLSAVEAVPSAKRPLDQARDVGVRDHG